MSNQLAQVMRDENRSKGGLPKDWLKNSNKVIRTSRPRLRIMGSQRTERVKEIFKLSKESTEIDGHTRMQTK